MLAVDASEIRADKAFRVGGIADALVVDGD
jgi:hypothetical protein